MGTPFIRERETERGGGAMTAIRKSMTTQNVPGGEKARAKSITDKEKKRTRTDLYTYLIHTTYVRRRDDNVRYTLAIRVSAA